MIEVVIMLAVVGFICWLVLNYVPMPQPFRYAIVGIIVLFLILYLVRLFGLDMSLPRR